MQSLLALGPWIWFPKQALWLAKAYYLIQLAVWFWESLLEQELRSMIYGLLNQYIPIFVTVK